jgi:hypothetical protein
VPALRAHLAASLLLNPFEFMILITLAAGMGAMHQIQRFDGSEL